MVFLPFCARFHQNGRCGSVLMGGAGGPLKDGDQELGFGRCRLLCHAQGVLCIEKPLGARSAEKG